jgi:transposase
MDRRSSQPEVLRELRERAVAMKQLGKTHREIAQALDIGESTSRLYWSLHKKGGSSGLELGKRGRPPGTHRRLNPRQEKAIQKVIIDKTPDQLKMPFALWTRDAISQLILDRYGLRLPVRTMGEYLRRWGFTPQKPKRRDYEQQPEAVRQWLEEEYPAIEKRAKAQGAEIYWGDETGINNQDQVGRSYAPKGKTPVRQARAKKVSVSMISAVTNKGQLRFMVYRKGMNAEVFVQFLKRLVRSSARKVMLIVDNLRAHKSKRVAQWLKEHREQIEVYYLPPYSPELNPDEYLNNTLKKQLGNHPPAGSVREQQSRVRSQMRSNQKKPTIIAALFRAPAVAYAA